MKNNATGFARIVAAAGFSIRGLKLAYQSEAAFRQEVWLAVVLLPAAWFVGDDSLQRAMLVASVLFLLIVELLNTAVEKVVDRVGDEYHPLSGAAKDIGSAAVFVALLLVGIVWLGVIL